MSGQNAVKAFLGKGMPFPMAPNKSDKGIDYESGAQKVRQSIWIILQTEPGERLMRPTFGCALKQYLIKPNNAETWSGMARDIQRALSQWEPRISLESVDVTGGDDPAVAMVRIRYQHKQDGSRDNLVFPFYLS